MFSLIPMVWSFFLGFMHWGLINKPTFAGLDNYIELFYDKTFWLTLKNTVIFSFIKVPLNLFLSLLLAILLNKKNIGNYINEFFRTVIFIPSVCSAVSVAIIWQPLMESSKSGLLNHYLNVLGFDPIPFLSSTQWAMPSVIFVGTWMELGFFMIIFLAGLQGIPSMYYEAASIDGANEFQKFFKITLPLISPTTFFALITSLISSFQIFSLTSVLTNGGPANSTNTLVMYLYQNGFRLFRMGYASAIAEVLFVVILIFTFIQNQFSKKWVNF
ncbi:MAG: sugar ABC transporter permease [Lachnospiraceae bacterium]|nr:sugar ABC transporter permease [Lachnospiraceae bacterium]